MVAYGSVSFRILGEMVHLRRNIDISLVIKSLPAINHEEE